MEKIIPYSFCCTPAEGHKNAYIAHPEQGREIPVEFVWATKNGHVKWPEGTASKKIAVAEVAETYAASTSARNQGLAAIDIASWYRLVPQEAEAIVIVGKHKQSSEAARYDRFTKDIEKRAEWMLFGNTDGLGRAGIRGIISSLAIFEDLYAEEEPGAQARKTPHLTWWNGSSFDFADGFGPLDDDRKVVLDELHAHMLSEEFSQGFHFLAHEREDGAGAVVTSNDISDFLEWFSDEHIRIDQVCDEQEFLLFRSNDEDRRVRSVLQQLIGMQEVVSVPRMSQEMRKVSDDYYDAYLLWRHFCGRRCVEDMIWSGNYDEMREELQRRGRAVGIERFLEARFAHGVPVEDLIAGSEPKI